ncbi:hypothetical protein VKT23_008897 [Stygiomarasmius scandens]|uniref:DUF7587 domain-containing protein n=1 Tax=Marasmiellus scandens TaxID=2682957 RepID=A0ABR1JFV9_9AGAR
MASNLKVRSEIPHDEYRFLPQVGFGQDVTFDTIATYNKFLFRIYTPKAATSRDEDSPSFVASKFNTTYAPSTPVLSDMHLPFGQSLSETATYEDCINHLNWETRSSSPFISASFSFAWAIWDAVRRYNNGIKHDVEIAVIDATALTGKAVTALQLLRKAHGTPHQKHWRWQRFAQESQSVLVYGFIPRSAVLASVPLLSVLDRLPSYFTKPSTSERPLYVLSWDFDSKQSTYRKFCQEMADRFVRLPFQTRVRDTAVGSVRLAITLLDPWFHVMVHEDLQKAVAKAREMASVIAHWPEPSGSRETNEMGVLIRSLIYLLAEEVRAKHTCKTEAEVSRLQGVIDRLEDVVHDQEKLLNGRSLDDTPNLVSHGQVGELAIAEQQDTFVDEFPGTVPLSTSPTRPLKITIPSFTDTSSSGSSSTSPITPSDFSTPSLPPTPSKSHFVSPILNEPPSPIFSSISTQSSPPHSPLLLPSTHLASPLTPLNLQRPLSSHEDSVGTPPVPSTSSTISGRERPSLAIPLPAPWSSLASATSPSAYFSALPSLPTATPEMDSHMSDGCRAILGDLKMYLTAPSSKALSPLERGSELEDLEVDHQVDVKGKGKAISEEVDEEKDDLFCKNDEEDFEVLQLKDYEGLDNSLVPEGYRSPSRYSGQDTVSCVISGFLVGAFITLCILSSQRRTLITNLT